ncbi:hypothetical protein [Dorea longicatena]|uniref:hypothetical protein n=1 Tax=Dorea longicatena TaxID=88431 RepID=UPI00156F3AAE|nr:hypothetical protein [Dorea longicatena]NSD68148.1 hypothetical protein [Dorea longicatena]
MRKKIFNVVMATVLTVAMGVTAFAANSPTASGVVTANTGKDANGKEIYYTVEPVKAEYASAVAEIKTVDGLKAALGSAYVDGMEVVDVRSIVLHEKEIATYAMDGGVAFPLTLTFSVPGVVKGTKVAILSYVNGIWQMLQCVAGDGTISAVFDSEAQFEAVAFVVDKNTTAGGGQTSGKNNQTALGDNGTSSTTNGTATNSKVSPKTGENTVIPVVMFAAIALLAAGTYCLRKREAR